MPRGVGLAARGPRTATDRAPPGRGVRGAEAHVLQHGLLAEGRGEREREREGGGMV